MDPRLARRLPLLVLPPILAAALLALVIHSVGAAPAATIRYASTTGSGFMCLKDNPCRLSIAVNNATTGDTIYVKGGIYTGVGTAVITVTKTITIFGGWDGDPAPGRPYRNPALYPTTLDGQNIRRGVVITGTIAPAMEGFIFAHGNATGLFAGCSASNAYGCGGGMFVYLAAARIRNNTFVSNTAMLTATDFHQQGHGGGLYIEVGSGAVISHNVFMSNTAAAVYTGAGGGLEVDGNSSPAPTILNNQFIGNMAPTWGGGAATQHTAFIGLYDNVFENNSADLGGGLFTWYASSFVVDGNTFRGNSGEEPIYLGYAHGGFSNNLVIDNLTDIGLEVVNGGGGAVDVVNNIIAQNGGTGIQAESFPGAPLTLRPYHNTLVGPGSGTAVLVTSGPATITLVNTLVSGFSVGFLTGVPTSTVASADYTLFDNDVASFGVGALSHIFVGAAAFVDAPGRDYHILAPSAARDVGLITTVGSDIDGDLRNIGAGPDIGADETRFVHALELPVVRR
jgi:hypothetical protein